jgi:hypothetical protein
MGAVLDAIETPHLFRFAIVSLCTWARPQAIIDFDPGTQVDWNDRSLDLAPVGWIQTRKRRPRQSLTQCLAGWFEVWAREDAEKRANLEAAGKPLPQPGLIVYKRKRVATVKRAFRRLGQDLKFAGFTQYSFRHFMADQVKKLFRNVSRENRSLWLGHVVRDGSRTTSHYESDDPQALADVALATDCVIALIEERCQSRLFARESLWNGDDFEAIGARLIPKLQEDQGVMVGATGIEPVTPTMSRSSNFSISSQNLQKSAPDARDRNRNASGTNTDLRLNCY